MVKRFPEEPKYDVALGATLVDRGEHGEAAKVLEAVAKKAPANLRGNANYHLARNRQSQGEPAKALAHLESASKDDPTTNASAAAWLLKGQIHESLDDKD